MTWSDDARRKSRKQDADEIARRAAAVRALKDRLRKTHLTPEELDEALEPVECHRERLRRGEVSVRRGAGTPRRKEGD